MFQNIADDIDYSQDDVDALLFDARLLIQDFTSEKDRAKRRKDAKGKEPDLGDPDEDDAAEDECESGAEEDAGGSKEDLLRSNTEWMPTYSANDIRMKLKYDRDALIIVALLSKGDYDEGLASCGPKIALALALCGYGSQLCNLVRSRPPDFKQRLADWRNRVKTELATNSQGLVGRKERALAEKLTDDFPDLRVVNLYLKPLTSARKDCPEVYGDLTWSKPMDVAALAGLMHSTFGDLKTTVHHQLRTLIWQGALLEHLRYRALGRPLPKAASLLGVGGTSRLSRRAGILDIKIKVDPTAWVKEAERGLPVVETNAELAEQQKALDRARYDEQLAREGKERSAKSTTPKSRPDPFDPVVIACPGTFLQVGNADFYEQHRSKIERLPKRKVTSPKEGYKDGGASAGGDASEAGNRRDTAELLAEMTARKKSRYDKFDARNFSLSGNARSPPDAPSLPAAAPALPIPPPPPTPAPELQPAPRRRIAANVEPAPAAEIEPTPPLPDPAPRPQERAPLRNGSAIICLDSDDEDVMPAVPERQPLKRKKVNCPVDREGTASMSLNSLIGLAGPSQSGTQLQGSVRVPKSPRKKRHARVLSAGAGGTLQAHLNATKRGTGSGGQVAGASKQPVVIDLT